jgi:hypothetical protein
VARLPRKDQLALGLGLPVLWMASLAPGGSALPLPRAIYRSCLLILVPTVKLGYAEWSENPPRSWSCSWFLNLSANKRQHTDQISQIRNPRGRTTANNIPTHVPPKFEFRRSNSMHQPDLCVTTSGSSEPGRLRVPELQRSC